MIVLKTILRWPSKVKNLKLGLTLTITIIPSPVRYLDLSLRDKFYFLTRKIILLEKLTHTQKIFKATTIHSRTITGSQVLPEAGRALGWSGSAARRPPQEAEGCSRGRPNNRIHPVNSFRRLRRAFLKTTKAFEKVHHHLRRQNLTKGMQK